MRPRVWNLKQEFVAERNALVAKWLPLVWHIAKRFWKAGGGKSIGSIEDCFQEGVIGLVAAIEGYDPVKGCKFATYAYRFIHGYMLHEALSRKRHWNFVPVWALKYCPDARKIKTFCQPDEPEETFDNLATIGRAATDQTDDVAEHDQAANILASLHPRERDILQCTVDGLTLEQIGKRHGVSRQRIRQLKVKAIAKVRRRFKLAS